MKCTFEFICDRKWEELESGSNDKMKYCDRCNQFVYRADDKFQLEQLARKRLCAYYRPAKRIPDEKKEETDIYDLNMPPLLGRIVRRS